jgi:hypothetical protein
VNVAGTYATAGAGERDLQEFNDGNVHVVMTTPGHWCRRQVYPPGSTGRHGRSSKPQAGR